MGKLREGKIIFPLSDAFIILRAGLCGYQYGMGMFLIIILTESFSLSARQQGMVEEIKTAIKNLDWESII